MKLSWPWTGRSRVPRDRLLVLDDFFPHLLTGFRVAEYNAYLAAFGNVEVHSTLRDFDAEHARYRERYPQWADRVRPYTRRALAGCGAAYLNFLNNAAHFVPLLERARVPFGMTLYPGGGLGLREAESDAKLLRVLSSPLLRTLTVTQPVTRDYVVDFAQRHRLALPELRCIWGVVVNPMYFDPSLVAHGPYFGAGKSTFDICFVAEKYMPLGANKGYPEFIGMALALAAEPHVRFHVVGSFTPADVDVAPLGERVRFHGRIETAALPRFFAGMDLVVSPNKPFLLHAGNFDGFPTGGCVEASLCGVAVMASDVLGQNPGYPPDALCIVPPEPQAMLAAVQQMLAEPRRVAELAQRGQELTRRWYAPAVQIGQRFEALQALAASAGLALQPRVAG